jgi:hypothetical protein
MEDAPVYNVNDWYYSMAGWYTHGITASFRGQVTVVLLHGYS